jgi:hypothetical protein
MRLDRTAGGAIELRQRQRRAQFEGASALLLRDSDSGPQGFFAGSRVRGITLQQNFAARPVQFGVERGDRSVRTSSELRRGSRPRDRLRLSGLRLRRDQS